MGKIIFWLGIFAAVFIALKAIAVIQRKGTLKDDPNTPDEATPPAPGTQKSLPSLIACAKCGLHLPRKEAVERQGRYFCSADHAD
jgi:uncharacterized protein